MSVPPARQRWLLQPLVDAGLTDDEIADLVVGLAFDGVVAGRAPAPGRLDAMVGQRPAAVRAAWFEVLDRMTAAGADAPG
ncbi:hypothetical protein [Geodermatophilus nigrescens]|uniref:hypothetical protein n=1 Tax=Geodermatophilus nigrescens TaxID=1070870 RepID=UPI00093383E3|nr:hypothetical protein [Geodermatophilus nigrescens]